MLYILENNIIDRRNEKPLWGKNGVQEAITRHEEVWSWPVRQLTLDWLLRPLDSDLPNLPVDYKDLSPKEGD